MNKDSERETAINNMRNYAEEQFDKLIVYFNSGALVLTIGFVKDIIVMNEDTNKTLLILSWSAFALSLFLILLSHKTALFSADNETIGEKTRSDLWDNSTKCLNWISFILFFTGVALFIIFITKNL